VFTPVHENYDKDDGYNNIVKGTGWPSSWRGSNLRYLREEFNKSDFFNVKSIENFNLATDQNSFYVISIGSLDDLKMYSDGSTIWDKIPKKSKQYIKKYNIPILLFFPFETTSQLSSSKSDNQERLVKFFESKRKAGFKKNKTVLFSLSNFDDQFGNPVIKSNPMDLNVHYAVSCLFFNEMKRKIERDRVRQHKNETSWFCDKEKVLTNPTAKKYGFLCLNHRTRINRTLLCQALYVDSEGLWDNNIISALETHEFKFQNTASIETEIKKRKCYELIDRLKQEAGLIKNNTVHEFLRETDFNKLFTQVLHDVSQRPTIQVNDLVDMILDYKQKFKDSDILLFVAEYLANTILKGGYPQTILTSEKHIENHSVGLNERWDINWYRETYFSLITDTV